MRPLLLVAFVATLGLAARPARADLPPPDDQKTVGFTFSVRGLSAATDRVVLAYPCGGSNGVPYRELAVLEEGKPVRVGRRGGNCLLYSMDRAEYETWAKTYAPKPEMQNDAADALVARAVRCTGAPALTFSIAKDDPREEVTDALEVRTLSATSCVVASTSPSPAVTPAAQRGSCGRACAAGGKARGTAAFSGLAVMTLLASALRRRHRRST